MQAKSNTRKSQRNGTAVAVPEKSAGDWQIAEAVQQNEERFANMRNENKRATRIGLSGIASRRTR
jgi:hypothetical protein